MKPIPLSAYYPYICKRLEPYNLSASRAVVAHWMQVMQNIPNFINELGSYLLDHLRNRVLTEHDIDATYIEAAQSNAGRYQAVLFAYSKAERRIIHAIAKADTVDSISGQWMQTETGLASSNLSRYAKKLEACPLLGQTPAGALQIVDPFLKQYIRMRG